MTDQPVDISKSGMTGTGSDTRMYAPRSESSHMYRNNHEEDDYGTEDGVSRDERFQRKQKKKEEEKRKLSHIKHIKIKPSDLEGLEDEDEREDDSEKIDDDRELSALTGPPGNGGFETSMAQGAKGPGAAAGQMFAMSEPMIDAWSELMKAKAYKGVGSNRNFSPITRDLEQNIQNSVKDKEAKIRGNRNHRLTNTVGVKESLTSGQRSMMDGVKNLLRRYGSFDNIPEQLRRKHLANFFRLDQTRRMKRNDANYDKESPTDRKFVETLRNKTPLGTVSTSTGDSEFRTLTPKQKRSMGRLSEFTGDLGQAMEVENLMDDTASYGRYNRAIPPVAVTKPRPTTPPVAVKPAVDEEKIMNEAQQKGISFDENGNMIFGKMILVKNESSKKRAKRRDKEARAHWRPSTGQFKTPPGGTLGPKGATGRRAKAQRRAVSRGKLTGMMDAPKAVEMEHRGVSVKQPMSKFPGKYKEYMGQQEARNRLGNVRVPHSSQRRYGQRSYFAGKTGGGRLPGVKIQRPKIHSPRMSGKPAPMRLSKPKMSSGGLSVGRMGLTGMGQPPVAVTPAALPPPPPIDPNQIQTSADSVINSSLTKGISGDLAEMRRMLFQLRREIKDKDKKSKGDAGEDKPKTKNTPMNQTSRPEGATEDATNDSRAFGIVAENRAGVTP